MPPRLERSNTNRVIAGVCGGLAEYLAVDATLVRVLFVAAAFTGIGFIVYLVLLILMPLPGRPAPFTTTPTGSATSADTTTRMESDHTGTAPSTVAPIDPAVREAEAERRRMAVGFLLIGLGIVFSLSNSGFRFVQWQFIWPLVLIAIGVLLLLQRVRS